MLVQFPSTVSVLLALLCEADIVTPSVLRKHCGGGSVHNTRDDCGDQEEVLCLAVLG